MAINRFSRFCTAHGSVSSGMPRHVLSPNNCPFASGIWPHLMHASLGLLESITHQHLDRFSHFCTVQIRVFSDMSFQLKIAPSHGDLYPHLICGFLGPPDLASKMASRAVQLFLYSSWQKVPILYSGRPFPQKLPLCMGRIWTPSIHDSLGPSKPITQTASRSLQPQGSLV